MEGIAPTKALTTTCVGRKEHCSKVHNLLAEQRLNIGDRGRVGGWVWN